MTQKDTAKTVRRTSKRREKLLETATDLFAKYGYHATGIDRILAESGVAKMTMYKHFASKDELIAESIRFRGKRSRNWIISEIESITSDPEQRLLALFDVLQTWFEHDSFRGCPFVNASVEYGNAEDPIHVAAAEHKSLLRDYFYKQASDADFIDPESLADQVMLMMEGAIVTRQVSGPASPSRHAKTAMKHLAAAAPRVN